MIASLILLALVMFLGLSLDVISNRLFPAQVFDPALDELLCIIGLLSLATSVRHLYRRGGWSAVWRGLRGPAALVGWAGISATADMHSNIPGWVLLPLGLIFWYLVWVRYFRGGGNP